MPIKFACPSCNKAITMADNLAGKRARCGGCQTVFVVPASSGGTAVQAQARPTGAAPPKPAGVRPKEAAPKKSGTKAAFDFRMGGEEESGSQPQRPRRRNRGTLLFVLITLLFLGGAATAGYFVLGPEQLQKYWAQMTGAKPAVKPPDQVAQKEPEKNVPAKDAPAKDGPTKDSTSKDPAKDPMSKDPPAMAGSLKLEALNEPVLTPGATAKLTVKVQRQDCQGAVDIVGKAGKLTVKGAQVAQGLNQVDLELTVAKDASPGLDKIELDGSLGSVRGKTDILVVVKAPPVETKPAPMETKPAPMETKAPPGEVAAPPPAPEDPKVLAALEKLDVTIETRDNQPNQPVVAVFDTHQNLTDATLKELAGLKELQRLSLIIGPVTGAGFKDLAPLKQLRELNLAASKMADAGLKEMAALPQLQVLNLAFTKVTDTGIKDLVVLKQLRELILSYVPVTDAGLKSLAALPQLQKLDLEGSAVTDAGLKELAAFKQLQELDLASTAVTDAGLKELAALQQLQILALDNTKVTEAGLKDLAALKQLQELNLSFLPVTDAGLKELAALKQLKRLILTGTKVTDQGRKELQAALPQCKMPQAQAGVANGPAGNEKPAVAAGLGLNWQLPTTLTAGGQGVAVLQVDRGGQKGVVRVESLSDKIKVETTMIPADVNTANIPIIVPKETPAGKHVLKLRVTMGENRVEGEIGIQIVAAPK